MFDRKAYNREYSKEYGKRDYVIAKRKAWAIEHKEEKAAYQKEWYRKNKEKVKARAKEHQIRWYDALKTKVLTYYSEVDYPECVRCRETRLPCLSLDHINNNGAEHRRQLNGHGGKGFYDWIDKNNYPHGYQTLCMNCQFLKEHERRRGIV